MRTKLVNGIPVPFTAEEEAQRDAEEQAWADSAVKRGALQKIAQLEASITERRKREAILSQEGKDWLLSVDLQIAEERSRLA